MNKKMITLPYDEYRSLEKFKEETERCWHSVVQEAIKLTDLGYGTTGVEQYNNLCKAVWVLKQSRSM